MDKESLKHFGMTVLGVVTGLIVYNMVVSPALASFTLAAPATTTAAATTTATK